MLFPIGDGEANNLVLFIHAFIGQEPVGLKILQLLKCLSFRMHAKNTGQ